MQKFKFTVQIEIDRDPFRGSGHTAKYWEDYIFNDIKNQTHYNPEVTVTSVSLENKGNDFSEPRVVAFAPNSETMDAFITDHIPREIDKAKPACLTVYQMKVLCKKLEQSGMWDKVGRGYYEMKEFLKTLDDD